MQLAQLLPSTWVKSMPGDLAGNLAGSAQQAMQLVQLLPSTCI